MTPNRARALLCVTLTALLGGCAAAGRSAPPNATYESNRENDPAKKLGHEPRSIAGWEARIQSHSATLHALTYRAPGSGSGSGTSGGTTGSTTSPSPPPPTSPPHTGPTPGAARPSRRPATRYSPVTPSDGRYSKLSIRCRKICRHVRAICYAARRICQIAKRVDSDAARAACQRNRNACTSARAVTIRSGCTTCGHANRRRKSNRTRRACLR